jgi:hypothetical protein
MSMEMHVLFRGKLPRKAALTRTMKELGFPFSIAPPAGSLEQQTGYMPMRFRRDESGVEFDVFEGRADVEDIAGDHLSSIDPGFDRSANFRWGGDETEMLAGMCAAAALAKLVSGIVIEDEEGLLLSIDEGVAFARKHLDAIVKPQGKDKRPGTRPADIKRYLKPLLKLRSDLVLVDRLLVVRPIRHLVRGAYLGRTSDRYSFRIWCHIKALYEGPAGVGWGDYFGVANCPVWQPHFEPLLIDALSEDIFGQVGSMTTLADLAQFIEKTGFREERVTTLVLAGELERAADYVQQIQRDDTIADDAKASVKAHWDLVSGDVQALCNECHAKEAETIKELKLEHIWEPSPFPVEVPTAERTSRTADPAFSTTPWISRPPWLLQEAPERPGEVRFAKDIHYRNGRLLLQVPLTPEQAEERHRDLENYSLVVPLPEGHLLLVRRFGWDRNDPEILKYRPDYRPSLRFIVEFYDSSRFVQVSAHQNEEDASLIDLWSISAPKWQFYAILRDGHRSVYDSRSGEHIYAKTPLTAAERDLIRCPMPGFGEYTDLVERIRSLLRYAGYGELT